MAIMMLPLYFRIANIPAAVALRASRLPALPHKLDVAAPSTFWLLATAFVLRLLATVFKWL